MDDLLSQLRDIRGIDNVSWWPLAPGWWALLALLLGMGAGVFFYRLYRSRKAASWQAEVRALFTALHAQTGAKKKAEALSELLRRLAIHQYGRDACAGLHGAEWLEWLATHDPQGFEWQNKAQILIKAPYAPGDMIDGEDMKPLIAAAERWVK